MKKLLVNLPLIISAAITAAFSLDMPWLRPLKTETSFGIWVAVLVPTAVVLLIVQVALWVRWPWTRPLRRPHA